MGSRWWSLVVLASLTACEFDPSGTGRNGGDDTAAIDGAAAAIDGAPAATDASLATPFDAADTPGPVSCGSATCATGMICCVDFDGSTCTTEQDCQGATVSCDDPSDCPGEACCMYAGLTTTCSPICLGGDQVCETASDCGGLGGQCCASSLGPRTCRVLCF